MNTGLKTYPNPFENQIKLDFKETQTKVNIEIINLQGQIIWTAYYEEIKSEKIEFKAPSGNYLIQIKNDKSTWKIPLIKLD